jgi:hypothetical protein
MQDYSPMMTMSVKVPTYILTGTNVCVGIESLAKYDDQGTLIYYRDCQQGNMSLRHADSRYFYIL